MKDKYCKDITEDLFEKSDRHYRGDEEIEPLPGMEPLDYQQLLEKKRLHKLQKNLSGEE
ncbi:MAG: hypothetical protein K0Q50_362 [Vampirovibrio sp.]|jgi:hypothetical protein|nr:hypothetical protein [Vampirovibrio sp.]